MPNFAAIHQRQMQKMESIVQYEQRKQDRAEQLRSSNEKKRNSTAMSSPAKINPKALASISFSCGIGSPVPVSESKGIATTSATSSSEVALEEAETTKKIDETLEAVEEINDTTFDGIISIEDSIVDTSQAINIDPLLSSPVLITSTQEFEVVLQQALPPPITSTQEVDADNDVQMVDADVPVIVTEDCTSLSGDTAPDVAVGDEKENLNESFTCESPSLNNKLPVAEHTLKDEDEVMSSTPVKPLTKTLSAPVASMNKAVTVEAFKTTGSLSSGPKRPAFGFADTTAPMRFAGNSSSHHTLSSQAGASSKKPAMSHRTEAEKRHQEMYKATRTCNLVNKTKSEIKGVRLNKRFMLLMQYRKDMDSKESLD